MGQEVSLTVLLRSVSLMLLGSGSDVKVGI
jgi:hypothetical protein